MLLSAYYSGYLMQNNIRSVFVHIVTFNNAGIICKCLDSIINQEGFELGNTLRISVSDNASSDLCPDIISANYAEKISLRKNKLNLGFCAAHNAGVFDFLQSGMDLLLIVNPDLKLQKNTLLTLVQRALSDPLCGGASPKLYRADSKLDPLNPLIIDSAGMILCNSLRHFDRGSGEKEVGQFPSSEYVFGVSGACMLLKRAFVEDMLIDDGPYSMLPSEIFPSLYGDRLKRAQLFDEAFFAYREDADLAWRAERTKWRFLYVPEAVAYHTRVVLPERRKQLDPVLNRHSVRNRFLLQVNNYSAFARPEALVPGIFFRNLIVILGVLFFERSSLQGLREFIRLLPRALYIRKKNKERKRNLKDVTTVTYRYL
ncbi:MAG: glycosyltransferase [SAR324 cluster bacterium]|uniref:Glycosyltransferase n=1 Tax=SAR324 cluster bacterium TaxID=2024889 RepID=A0A7X9FSE3_9DELT|nr:glycosyltransferase [SAR324 cluster bacterium]